MSALPYNQQTQIRERGCILKNAYDLLLCDYLTFATPTFHKEMRCI